MLKTTQPPGAVGLQKHPRSCQLSTVRAGTPLHMAMGTCSGRDRGGRPGGGGQQRKGIRKEGQKLRRRGQRRSCGCGAGAFRPTRTTRFRQSLGTTKREEAGWAGSWTPISGGWGGHGGLGCSGGGRSVRVRARADQELRDRRRGGVFQPLPSGASWWQAGPELLSSLSTEGGSGAGREPTRPLVLSQTKAATLDSGAGCWGSGALPGVAAGRVSPGQVGCRASGLGMGGPEDWVLLRPLSPARNSVRAPCLNLEGPSRKPGSWRQRPGGGGQPGGWGSLSHRSPHSPPSYWVPAPRPGCRGPRGARGAGAGRPGPHLLSPRKVSGQSITRDPECPLCP